MSCSCNVVIQEKGTRVILIAKSFTSTDHLFLYVDQTSHIFLRTVNRGISDQSSQQRMFRDCITGKMLDLNSKRNCSKWRVSFRRPLNIEGEHDGAADGAADDGSLDGLVSAIEVHIRRTFVHFEDPLRG